MARDIERICFADFEDLSSRVERVDAPCIIEGGLRDWPAFGRWTPAYLREKLGGVEVKYKVSSSHVHPDLHQSEIEQMFRRQSSSFAAFLEAITEGPPEERARFLLTGDEQFLVQRRDGVESIGPALAPLLEDVRVPVLVPDDRLYTVWAWFSAAGVRTWLHYDNNGCHNLNAQLTGRKRCWLYGPEHLAALAPFALGGSNPAHNVSQIDVERPDATRFRDFASVPSWEGTLEGGELLFIPAFWWHTFEHLGEFNANVNYWWKPREPRLSRVAQRQALLDFVQEAGLDPRDVCETRAVLAALDRVALRGATTL